MQPLYSVDHETRQNSYRRDEDVESAIPVEDTPLLHRFPINNAPERSPITTITVAALLTILVLGVVIGFYLLIVMNNAENLLPPVEKPLQVVSRSQWDPSARAAVRTLTLATPAQASQVIVVQTDTDECHSTESCSSLLQKLQVNSTSSHRLPYNFLVSSNGQTYEALGWRESSPMFPHSASNLVLAFIGNFTATGPSEEQINEAQDLFAESVSRLHLTPHYQIIGKNTTYKPEYLFEAMKHLPQWNEEWSDA